MRLAMPSAVMTGDASAIAKIAASTIEMETHKTSFAVCPLDRFIPSGFSVVVLSVFPFTMLLTGNNHKKSRDFKRTFARCVTPVT